MCIKYGNYYGMRWSAGKNAKNMSTEEYIKCVKLSNAVDRLDQIAKCHDLGLELARDSSSGVSSWKVNWVSAGKFWKHGGVRGRFAGISLFMGCVTFLGGCYLSSKDIESDCIRQLKNILYEEEVHLLDERSSIYRL